MSENNRKEEVTMEDRKLSEEQLLEIQKILLEVRDMLTDLHDRMENTCRELEVHAQMRAAAMELLKVSEVK